MESNLNKGYITVYRGPTTERGVLQYSREWMDTALGSVDDLIVEQLNLSKTHGRQKVTILDIGSTRQATFFTDLLTNPSVSPETRRFLGQNPSFNLDLIGLTDARTQSELGTVVNSADVTNPQLRGFMRVMAYSLTAKQTFKHFLEAQKIDSPNLIFAVWSLAYLSPNIFREVLYTSSNSLESGGKFVGSGYSDSVSAFGFGMNYNQYPNIIYFDIPDPDIPNEVWPYLIGGPSYSNRPHLTTSQLRKVKQVLTKVIKPLTKQELISAGQSSNLLAEIRSARSIRRLSSTGATLQEPINALWNHKFQSVMKPKKDAIIQELMTRSDFTVESDFIKNISVLRS